MEGHSILGGKVRLYRRERSPAWQCAAYVEGKERRVSSREKSLARAKEFAEDYVANGMVADIAIHEDGTLHNPHVHVLLTVHQLKPQGFGPKIANVDHKKFVTTARRGWETITNKYLSANGLNARVDARSYKAQGLTQQPTRHRGPNRAERRNRRRLAREHQQSHEPQLEPVMANPVDDLPPHQRSRDRDDWPELPHERVADPSPTEPWLQRAMVNIRVQRERDHLTVDQRQLYGAQWDAELEIVERARAQVPTREEQALRESIANAPEAIRYQVEAQILAERARRLRNQDEANRLDYLTQQLEPEQLQRFERFVQAERESDHGYPLPEPGPYERPHSPGELAMARQRMADEYERDDEPDRTR